MITISYNILAIFLTSFAFTILCTVLLVRNRFLELKKPFKTKRQLVYEEFVTLIDLLLNAIYWEERQIRLPSLWHNIKHSSRYLKKLTNESEYENLFNDDFISEMHKIYNISQKRTHHKIVDHKKYLLDLQFNIHKKFKSYWSEIPVLEKT